jgi:Recombination endonuclease VII
MASHSARQKWSDKKYRAENFEAYQTYMKQWKESHRKEIQDYNRLHRYGLTPEDITLQLEDQDYTCGISSCNIDITTTYHIDHDHTCCPSRRACDKCLRGLLCRHHNLDVEKYDKPEYVEWRRMKWGLF